MANVSAMLANAGEKSQKRTNDKPYIIRRRALNLCINCGKEPAIERRVVGLLCLNRQRNRRLVLKSKGLCITCGRRSAEIGKTQCKNCNEVDNKLRRWILKLKALRILSGNSQPRCIKCGISDIHILCVNEKHEGKQHTTGKQKRISDKKLRVMIVQGKIPLDKVEVRCYNCNMLYEYETGRFSLPMNWETIVNDLIEVVRMK